MHPIILTIILTLATLTYPDTALAQTPTPTPTITPTILSWDLPTDPLTPYTYTTGSPSPEWTIDSTIMWHVARIALTGYTIISQGDNRVWLLLGMLLVLPIAGSIIYRLLVHPPDI